MILGLEKMRGAGDLVALVAKPIAKGIDAVTSGTRIETKLAECATCGKRREKLNTVLPFKA